jgi:hypothetical protein
MVARVELAAEAQSATSGLRDQPGVHQMADVAAWIGFSDC